MHPSNFHFVEVSSGNSKPSDIASLAEGRELAGQRWLFLSPHDDDCILAFGLLMQAAAKRGIETSLLVATDGSLGYVSLEQRDTIVETRRGETLRAYEMVGVLRERIYFLGFPDNSLRNYQGRRKAQDGDPEIEGYTGLQNHLTYFLRKIAPDALFVPTGNDIHIDHKVCNEELGISLFHASSGIWPELGPKISLPLLYYGAVYCDLDQVDFAIKGDEDMHRRKLDGIRTFASQKQIVDALASQRGAQPAIEVFQRVKYNFFEPNNYRWLFEHEQ
ncbi:MAG: PIG-L family deacetylase [Candidatus Dadabacteria bacterium]|nr:MAG: PIG-L family deacetylase [Candidatus Dadabacteria bacterium]